jgi:hypothetical protein
MNHLLLAGAAALAITAVAARAAAPADNTTLSAWMQGWRQAAEECRGSYPNDPAHADWCSLLGVYDAKLKGQGCRLVSLGTAMSSDRWSCPNSIFSDR